MAGKGKTRVVHDSFGELRVPAEALYGATTQRAVENFPISGLPLQHIDMTRFMYGTAIIAAPFVVGFIVYRMVAGPQLPDPLKPTLFIILVPGGLLYANYPIVSSEVPLFALAASVFVAVESIA